jgi:hypothetical protein
VEGLLGITSLISSHFAVCFFAAMHFRFLYKQRLFQMTVPKLVEGHREVHSEAAKVNFIQALSFQLKHIPKDILAMEMESVCSSLFYAKLF